EAGGDFDLEGEWNADGPVEVAPIRSAPRSQTPRAPEPKSDAARQSAAKRAAAMGPSAAGLGGVRTKNAGRKVLQYHKVENRPGMLGAELGQQTIGVRVLLYALVVAMFAALAYGAYSLTSASKRSAAILEESAE
ncbi:MAG: hypothetical protein O2816_06090, partial [Planctomycetota bacterium]|nr:hypothetical protein [Planctomycetota bacterium]